MRVIQPGKSLRLVDDALMHIRILDQHGLDRDKSIQPTIKRLEHITETTTTKPATQFKTVG